MPQETPNFTDAAVFKHSASGFTPASGSAAVYVKSDNKLYVKNASGTETAVLTDPASPPAIGATTAAAGTFTNVTSNNRNFLIPTGGAMRVGMNGTIGSGSAIAIISANEGTQYSATGGSSIAIGMNQCRASGNQSISIGSYAGYSGTGDDSITMGNQARAQAQDSLALLKLSTASNTDSIAIGVSSSASATGAIAIGNSVACDLRTGFFTRSFRTVYWGGTTTNNTATILNLDATATSRFTIASNTALAVDILLVARRGDVADKWLVARRFLGIRRDLSNNTALIGTVQTLGTDQSTGSPTWTFALTADDTNEALQLQVTGETGETIQWRATAFYRVV